MKRRGRQVYLSNDVWSLVEEAAKKDNDRSVNRWLEIHLTGYFLTQKLKEKK